MAVSRVAAMQLRHFCEQHHVRLRGYVLIVIAIVFIKRGFRRSCHVMECCVCAWMPAGM